MKLPQMDVSRIIVFLVRRVQVLDASDGEVHEEVHATPHLEAHRKLDTL